MSELDKKNLPELVRQPLARIQPSRLWVMEYVHPGTCRFASCTRLPRLCPADIGPDGQPHLRELSYSMIGDCPKDRIWVAAGNLYICVLSPDGKVR